MIRNILKFVFLFLLFASNGFAQEHTLGKGTTVVVIIRGDTIWAGADSQVVYANIDGDLPPIVSLNNCKILKFGDFVFTHSGIYSDDNGNLLPDTVRKIFDRGIFLEEDLAKVNDYTLNLMNYIIETYKINYEALETNNIFLYFQGDSAKALIYEYTVPESLSLLAKPKVNLNVVKLESFSGYKIYIAGIKEEGMEYVNNTPGIENESPEAVIDHIIKLESETHPRVVGGDIDIIRITKDGSEWLKCKDGCR